MKIHVLTNALCFGDAVSAHCILLAQRARELGIEASIYAEFSDAKTDPFVTPVDRMRAGPGDLLLHQFFNHTALIRAVESFPGRRVLMYHNITPPEFFPAGSEPFESCRRGLAQLAELSGLYHYAVGMSEFSRRDLALKGFSQTGVFPLFIDMERLRARTSDLNAVRRFLGTTFLFVGRIAPNKGIPDLLRFLEAYRQTTPDARLVLVGDDQQHPAYTRELLQLAARLGLRTTEDVLFTGKISDGQVAAWYQNADAFICLSRHEGFGAPLMEAMMFGVPVFAAAAGAVADTLGGAGALLPDREPEAVAEAVRAALFNPHHRDAILQKQKARAEMFSAAAQRKALRDLVDRDYPQLAPPRAPRVSVVINTYNRARHLETCLATLRRQTYRNFEVVVINGPSTDNTAEILKRFEGQIRVAETTRRVLGVSRNLGIEQTSGELVAFIDDDAIADPHWLAELVKPFSDPAVGAAGGLVYRMNGQDIEFRNGIIDPEGFVEWNRPQPGQHWTWKDGFLNTVSGNNCIFRRSALEAIGGFDEAIEYYHDEADVVMRLAAQGLRTVHCPSAVVYHEGAASQNRTGKYTLNWRVIAKNTVYCALKNHQDQDSRKAMARRIARRVVQERMADILHWWLGGEIGAVSFVRMEIACIQGIVTGIRRGLVPPLPPRPIAPAGERAFLPYAEQNQHGLSVCLLSQSLPEQNPGGIATYTLALAGALQRLGCTVHIVSKGEDWKSEPKDGIWFHTAPPVVLDRHVADSDAHPSAARNLMYSNGVRIKLLDVHARWGIDVIESPNWDAEGLLAAIEHRVPMVVRAHSPLFKVAETQGWEVTADLEECMALEDLLLRHADMITGSTRGILDLIEPHAGGKHATALLPLGIDIDAGASSRPQNPCRKILFAGRLEPRKGIHTLLDAIPAVLERSENIEFDIAGADHPDAGEDSWKNRWERDAGRWKNHVRFHGEVSRDGLMRLYRDCDVFAAPSIYESFGLVYLEAMAHGKPAIGCLAGGVPEVVVDGATGLLIPPGDSAALARAILKLAQDEPLAEQMGAAGLARYRASFTVDVMGARTLELFQKIRDAQKSAGDVAWGGVIMDLRREPQAQVLWHAETEQLCLMIPAGEARTAVYGPYARLTPGRYRAEFKLWLDAAPPHGRDLGAVDVFRMAGGKLGERIFQAGDFAAGAGCILDVYFTVVGSSANDVEFRVHTSGHVPLFLREVVVRDWPPHRVAVEAPRIEKSEAVGA